MPGNDSSKGYECVKNPSSSLSGCDAHSVAVEFGRVGGAAVVAATTSAH